MNYLYTRRNIIVSLLLSLTIVSFFVWYTYRNMKKAGYETRVVNKTLQSLRALEDMMDHLQDIETGYRAYLISGNKQFLTPYYSAFDHLKHDTLDIKALYPLYPQRKTQLDGLLNKVRQKISYSIFSENQLTDYNPDSTYQLVHSAQGRLLMDSIRQIVLTLENEDRRVLQFSNAQRDTTASLTAKLFGVLAMICIIILVILFFQIYRDLKRRHINEKKIAYLADIMEQTGDAIISTDTSFTILSWNKGAEEMYGYTKIEAIGSKYHLLLQSRRTDDDRNRIVEMLKMAGYFAEELEYNQKNNKLIFVQASYTILKDKENNITGCSIVHRNITERKNAEKLLLEFNEKLTSQVQQKTLEINEVLDRFKIITKATNDVVWDSDLRNETRWWNDNFYEKLGHKISDETTNPHFWEQHIHPDDRARVTAHINYVLYQTAANIWSNEYRFMKADGSFINIYDRSYIMRDENGMAFRMIGSMADVTDLFIAREELNQSEEKYRSLVEQATDGIFMADQEGRFVLVNSSAIKLLGYTNDELLRMSIFDIITKENIRSHPLHLAELREGKNLITERVLIKKNGETIYVEVNARSLNDGRLLAFVRDITEKRKVEEAIVKSNARFHIISKATSDIVWDWNLLDNSLWWNDNYYSNLGYEKQKEIVEIESWYNLVHPDDVIRVKSKIQSAISGNDLVWRDEYRYIKADGTFLNFLDRGYIIRDKEGKAYRMIGSMADITDLFLTREELKLSEEKYRALVEQAADAIALFDAQGKILEVNKSASQLLGYSHTEFLRLSLPDILTKEEISKNPVEYNLLEKGLSTIKQRKMRRKDGQMVITEVNSKILPDGRFLTMVRDLTDRIDAQKQIEKEKDLSDNIIDSLPGVFYLYDDKGKFIRWNKQLEIVTGYSANEITDIHPTQLFEGDDKIYIAQRIAKVFAEGIGDAEADFVSKDGRRIPYYFKAILIDFEGRPCLLGTGIDISDRKNAEKELSDSYKAIRKLTSHLQNIREEDRAHIAREIHDELGQQLTVLKMDVSWINKKINTTDDLVKQKMKDLLSMLDEAVKTVRRISAELRPSLLDDLGLTAAIEWQLQEFKKRSDIKSKFTAPEKEIILSDMVKTGLFRIFQESLTNVVRHSHAKKMEINLEQVQSNLILSIQDDGKGFDKAKITDKRTLGILGMKERTAMIGGTYEIISIPGKGTNVIVSVPMNTEE